MREQSVGFHMQTTMHGTIRCNDTLSPLFSRLQKQRLMINPTAAPRVSPSSIHPTFRIVPISDHSALFSIPPIGYRRLDSSKTGMTLGPPNFPPPSASGPLQPRRINHVSAPANNPSQFVHVPCSARPITAASVSPESVLCRSMPPASDHLYRNPSTADEDCFACAARRSSFDLLRRSCTLPVVFGGLPT
jgi:hypothetical protein